MLKKILTPNNLTLSNLYRKMSGSLLSLAVKTQVIGDTPNADNATTMTTQMDTTATSQSTNQPNALTFYVLKEYSRSNSILIDLETQKLDLPPALASVQAQAFGIDEKTAMIFLNHPKGNVIELPTNSLAKNFSDLEKTGRQSNGLENNGSDKKVKAEKNARAQYSPRLLRLIEAVKHYPELNVQFIPVTILWGRTPEKEDSIFNLLTADEWQVPSIPKQLFNIGVKGRDTFVQFHPAKDLRSLLSQEAQREAGKDAEAILPEIPSQAQNRQALNTLAQHIQNRLQAYLDRQQEAILGPDLSDRRNVVDKILYTPAVMHAIEMDTQSKSHIKNHSIYDSRIQARQYLNEITSDYSASVIRFFDRFLTWLWTQLYDGVEVQHFDRVRELASDYEIVYVPCHRSHMDYLLLSYVIYKRGLRIPHVAAGDNLNIPVLGQLLRNGGGFFMRRSFKDNPLYGAVFREYMHSMLNRNTPIEYFIEGGRSRSGRLVPPKKGMIAMTVQSHLRQASKPIVFIPTYIGYERIMEGATYVGEMKGKPKESESLLGLIKASRKIERIFGNVHVSFGKPLFLNDFMQKFDVLPNSLPPDRTDTPMPDNAIQMIENLSLKIMQRINRSAVVNPVSLLSLVLLSTPQAALDEQSCIEQIALYQRIAQALPYDEDVSITEMSPQSIINYGIKLKLIERTPHVLGDMIRVAQGQAALLSYFRNNILHIYIMYSLITTILHRNGSMSQANLQQLVSLMYPFLQAELFLKYPIRTLDNTIANHVEVLATEQIILTQSLESNQPLSSNQLLLSPDPNTRRFQQMQVLANSVEQSLERYFMVLALLSQQGSGKLSKVQVIDLCHLLGQRLSVLYEDDMPDFFDRALFSSFIDALARLDYITLDEQNLITFDKRIDSMAKNAHYILNIDVMHILQQIAQLNDGEIQRTLAELQQKKQSKFSRKKA